MKRIILTAVMVAAATGVSQGVVFPDSTIRTIAGTGTAGFSGDGGRAVRALLNEPRDSEVGPDGSIYVADTFNNRIRKISPNGTITTVAGNGSKRFNGDGIPATRASLAWPHDVFVDGRGVIYIADSNHHRIRYVTRNGIIHTLAGSGTMGSAGDGLVATNPRVRLKNPKTVFIHGHYLYFASLDNKVRRVNLKSRIISTYAGTGVAGYTNGPRKSATFNRPQRIQVDSNGNVYVADTGNSTIRRIGAKTGRVRTVAGTGRRGFNGDGVGTRVRLNEPRGIALEGDNLLYISDSNNQRIRRLRLVTGWLVTIAGGTRGYAGDGRPARRARFNQPRGITVTEQGDLIVADTFNSALRLIRHRR